MRGAVVAFSVLLALSALAPAFAFTCDNPCKDGEVWSDEDEMCVPGPRPVG